MSIFLVSVIWFLKFDIPFVSLYYKKKPSTGYSIGIFSGEDPTSFYDPPEIDNPILTIADINDRKALFIADPFMISYKKQWYLFFEILNIVGYQGDIGVATSNDGINWNYNKVVLDEPFHLSYPCVFFDNENIYIIPESASTNTVRLYKAVNFPLEWRFEKTLLQGLHFIDPTIFKYNNIWWLFTETSGKNNKTLRLYFTDDLYSAWHEHPQSPIIKANANIARPGGRVVVTNGKIFRYAQDCTPTYGNQVRVFEITKLNTNDYKEKECCSSPVLESVTSEEGKDAWRSKGMHQIDAHLLDNGHWLACVDGLSSENINQSLVLKINLPFFTCQISFD